VSEVAPATPPGERIATPLIVVDKPAGADALAKVLSKSAGTSARTGSGNRVGSDGRLGSAGNTTDLAAAAAMAVATPPPYEAAYPSPAAPPPMADGEPSFEDYADAFVAGQPLAPVPAAPVVDEAAAFAPLVDDPGAAGAPAVSEDRVSGGLGLAAGGSLPPAGGADASEGVAAPAPRPGVPRDACFACKRPDRDRSGQCRSCGYNNRDRKRHCRKCSKAELHLTTGHSTHRVTLLIALGVTAAATAAAAVLLDDIWGMALSGGLAGTAFWLGGTVVYACGACGEPAVGFPLQDTEESHRKILERVVRGLAAVLVVVTLVQPIPLFFRPTLEVKNRTTATTKAGRLARDTTTYDAKVYVKKGAQLTMKVSAAHDPGGSVELFLLAATSYTPPADEKEIPQDFVTHLLEGLVNGSVTGPMKVLSASPDHRIVEAPFEGSSGDAVAHTIYGTVRVHQLKDEVVVTAAGGARPAAQHASSVKHFLDDLKLR
jgi:hypothetical protein